MAQPTPNIFNPNQNKDQEDDIINSQNEAGNLELTDEDARNKVRLNIFKALSNENNEESLDGK